jgi:hypothetical protein
MRYFAWSCFFARATAIALVLCCIESQPTMAGSRDTHLVATNYIGTQLDLTNGSQIARANWSLDLNNNTTAVPTRDDLISKIFQWSHFGSSSSFMRRAPTLWWDRGRPWHSLDPSDAHGNLVDMRDSAMAVINSGASEEAKSAAIGQYLHATQDAYFHQEAGTPLDAFWGHFNFWKFDLGHEQDKVAMNFKAALRANQATYDILRHYRDSGYKELPNVKPVDQIYSTVTESDRQAKEIEKNNDSTGIYTLTKKLSDSYRPIYTYRAGPYLPNATNEPIDYAEPTLEDLKSNLATAWNDWTKVPRPGSGTWNPPDFMFNMNEQSDQKFDYYNKDAKLLMRPRAAPTIANLGIPSAGSFSGVSGATSPNGQRAPQSTVTGGAPASPTPGGISLSMAAASRLAININLDGLYGRQGRLVLSGRSDGEQSVDAALFYTALRLACEPNDPFFSLDPDNNKLWTEEGRSASEVLWKRIRADYDLDDPLGKNPQDGLVVRTLAAKRDYGQLWARIAPQYPNFKTRLVFRPEWLRSTRFGEVMYKADVLLKELDSGVPMLQLDPGVRAAKVDRYVSDSMRHAAESLLESVESNKDGGPPKFSGTRLWFDLAPRADDARPAVSLLDDDPPKPASGRPPRSTDPVAVGLRAALASRGFVDAPAASEPARRLAVDGDTADLSQIYPKIFVRAHDNSTGKDIDGAEPQSHAITEDVNRRIKQYAAAYQELRALTEAFRLYVTAVAFTQRDPNLCTGAKALPLLPTEQISQPLPEFHPSELYFSLATYTKTIGDRRRWWLGSSSSRDGGVSPRGKELYEREAAQPRQTPITAEIRQEAVSTQDQPVWQSKSGRIYVAIDSDVDAEFARYVGLQKSFKPNTHAMFLAELGIAAPSRNSGPGLLDDDPLPTPKGTAPSGKPGGLLEDIDTSPGIRLVPARP